MIRYANKNDIEQINVIRKQVNDLHVVGEPKIFKPGFCKEMQDFVITFIDSDNKMLLVYEEDNQIYAYAMLEIVIKKETPYRYELKFLEVQEIGTLSTKRSKGYGKALVEKIKQIAKENKIDNIDLNMWSFNEKALKFYKNIGFNVYRKYLRLTDF